jgi:hypothetical protein
VIVRPSSASAQAVLVDLESHAEVLDGFGFRLWVVGGGKLRMNRLEFPETPVRIVILRFRDAKRHVPDVVLAGAPDLDELGHRSSLRRRQAHGSVRRAARA